MKFPNFSLSLFHKSAEDFNDDVKNIIRCALDSEESFNLLLWGEPASSKILFLLELAKEKGAVFFEHDFSYIRCIGAGTTLSYSMN